MPPPSREQVVAEAVRQLQAEEDHRILEAWGRAHTTRNPEPPGLTPSTLNALREILDRHSLRAEQLLVRQEDFEDIQRWASGGNVTIQGGNATGVASGGLVTITGGSGAGTTGSGGAVTITGGRRVTVPEFELFSNPTIQIGEVRSRRFDLIDRSSSLAPEAARILSAVLRAKAPPPEPSMFVRVHTDPKTFWEVLVELDLVDASSS